MGTKSLILISSVLLVWCSASILAVEVNRPRGGGFVHELPFKDPPCNLPKEIIDEIKSYQPVADKIIADYTGNGKSVGRTWNELADFADKYPRRASGTQGLEDSIDYMMEKMKAGGQQEVHGEETEVTHWIRGTQEAWLLAPFKKQIQMFALGTSVSTPPEGIEADAVVVTSWDEMNAMADANRESKTHVVNMQIKGKIVIFNNPWNLSYENTVDYRLKGAAKAGALGAVATLIRSIASYSLNNPHTGDNEYDDAVQKIPTGCISVEDAEWLNRYQTKGVKIRISMLMAHTTMPNKMSRNVIGDIIGREFPKQIVGVSGHIDAWDVGQGTMDDGGGCVISVEALNAVKRLGLPQPRRTLRTILWTSEETGLWGVKGYVKQHKADLADWSAVFESDSGVFKPRGLDFAGSLTAGCIVEEVLKLTAAINTTLYQRYETVSSDIDEMIKQGVPGLSLNSENDKYFWHHHTESDTMSMQDPTELDLITALWTISSYVLADLKDPLPRK